MSSNVPKSLSQAIIYFSSNEQACFELMKQMKWPDGDPKCPKCECERVNDIPSRPGLMRCGNSKCRKQFSCKVNTVFEDSALPLWKWFVAVWFVANCKNGISSYELGRALEISQKSCWHMLHRIRCAMKAKSFEKIEGTIESDESFIGGKAKNMHSKKRREKIQGRGTVGKDVLHGILERPRDEDGVSRVAVAHVPNQKRRTLQSRVRNAVQPGSRVFTDSLLSYEGLEDEYIHDLVEHAKGEYVKDGDVHVNNMECFWNQLKRSLITYVSVTTKHLESYCDEQVFQFNEGLRTDAERFLLALRGIVGKRLQYRELVSKETSH